jgi:hypothetical protein
LVVGDGVFAGARDLKGLQALISGRGMADERPWAGTIATMAATNKYLARSNKSLKRIKATKKQNRQ